MYRVLIFLLIVCAMTSCQTAPYNISDKQYVSMWAEFHNLQVPLITLGYTRNPGSYDSVPLINNVQIKVWENGELLSGFKRINDGAYANLDFKPKPSAKYRVEAHVPDYGTVFSEFEMPPLVTLDFITQKVDSVVVINTPEYIELMEVYNGWDTGYVEVFHDAVTDTFVYMDFTIQYNDPPNEENYYSLDACAHSFYFRNTKSPAFDFFEGEELENIECFTWPMFPDYWYKGHNQLSFTIAYSFSCMKLDFISMFKDEYENSIQSYYEYTSRNRYDGEPNPLISFFGSSEIPDIEPIPFHYNVQGGIGTISHTTLMQYKFDPKLPNENEWIYYTKGGGEE